MPGARHLAILWLAILWLAIVVGASGCPGSSTPGPPIDPTGVKINGRVVDFETCLSQAGCQAAAGLRVSLFADSKVVSQQTGRDGAFSLANVQANGRHHLIVSDASGQARFLPTLQADALAVGAEDLFGVELYAVQAAGGLYAAVSTEADVHIEGNGLYLGQVVSIEQGRMKAIQGITPQATPSAQARFVRDNPRFNPGETALFPAERTATGVFGQFVLIADQAARSYTIQTSGEGFTSTQIGTPLGAGYLTVGVHRVQPR